MVKMLCVSLNQAGKKLYAVKLQRIWTPEKTAVIILKLEQFRFTTE